MKKLIINADDFGLSRSINRGIIEVFKKGALTSASLLVNMPGFDDAVSLIKDNPSLGVGLHINVVRGKPVSPIDKVQGLCEGDSFKGGILHLLNLAHTCKGLDEFAIECRAQIEKALLNGIQITHLDSEKHIHMITPFFKVMLKISQEYGISKIRCVNEIPYLRYDLLNKQLYTALYLSYCSKENKELLDRFNFNSPDYFYGISATGQMTTENYARILSNLREGTTEIMCHPGYIDDEWQKYPLAREKYYINAQRQDELKILLDPTIQELFKQQDISLMTYREL